MHLNITASAASIYEDKRLKVKPQYLRDVWIQIPHLVRNLTRDLIGPDWMFIRLKIKQETITECN